MKDVTTIKPIDSGNEVKKSEEIQDTPKTDAEFATVESDSTANFNTSCKFNFIFYFLYKMKYDDNAELKTKLNYPL